VVVLENLRGLVDLPFGEPFELFAFPLRLQADASPVRAVARLP
jgi:kynurenine formamidase